MSILAEDSLTVSSSYNTRGPTVGRSPIFRLSENKGSTVSGDIGGVFVDDGVPGWTPVLGSRVTYRRCTFAFGYLRVT